MKFKRLLLGLGVALVCAVHTSRSEQGPNAGNKLNDELRVKAEKGDTGAQRNLGQRLFFGIDGIRDEVEGAKWLREATAKDNDAGNQFVMFVCYVTGRGVPKDEVEAAKWLRKAADQNLPWAQDTMGSCYRDGQGVATNYEEAVKWYRKAADQSFARGQYHLGACYLEGRGVSKSEEDATYWLRKAAMLNHAQAQFVLGLCYFNGRGVAKDEAEGAKWLFLSAAQAQEDTKQKSNTSLEGTIREGQQRANDWIEKSEKPFARQWQ